MVLRRSHRLEKCCCFCLRFSCRRLAGWATRNMLHEKGRSHHGLARGFERNTFGRRWSLSTVASLRVLQVVDTMPKSSSNASDLYFKYAPLPKESIRLLKIHDSAEIHSQGHLTRVSFEIHELSSCPPYVALSYTWGEPTDMGDAVSQNLYLSSAMLSYSLRWPSASGYTQPPRRTSTPPDETGRVRDRDRSAFKSHVEVLRRP